MNPGAMEQGARIATSVVEALKSQPLALAMVVFNLIFVLVVYFAIKEERAGMRQIITMLLEQRQQTIEMMAKINGRVGQ